MITYRSKTNEFRVIAFLVIAFIAVSVHSLFFAEQSQRTGNVLAGDVLTVTDNGGWCWIQDERAIIVDDRLYVGYVAGSTASEKESRGGNVEVSVVNFKTGKVENYVLHPHFEIDDHDAPSLLLLPDNSVLAAYSKHGHDNFTRWKIFNIKKKSWSNESIFDNKISATYTNLLRVPNADATSSQIFNFVRTRGWDPNFLLSDDDGLHWRYGGHLLEGPGRPYVKYASNGGGKIHFMATEDHPLDYNNSVYYGFVTGGRSYKATCELVDENIFDASAPSPQEFTKVFSGNRANVAWLVDIEVDKSGNPRVLFSVQKHNLIRDWFFKGQDHRYYYARLQDRNWIVREIAYAGTRLYAREDDYTGLAALDPNNPEVVVISTNADPTSGRPLVSKLDGKRHYELFSTTINMSEEKLLWRPVTHNSAMDNIRPLIPCGLINGSSVLIWMRGEYRKYTDYNTQVVAMRLRK